MLKNQASPRFPASKQKTRVTPRPDDISGTFGVRVMEERKRQRISRDTLAQYADVSADVIKRVENGMGAKLEDAYRIATALHVPLYALLPRQEEDRAARIHAAKMLLDELEMNSK